MLGNEIVGEIFGVEISRDIGYLPAALLEIFHRVLKKLVIIGLEAKLAAGLQNVFILLKLSRMGKSALVVLASVPGIAEVYVNTVNGVILPE